jgi:hypothetical protein
MKRSPKTLLTLLLASCILWSCGRRNGESGDEQKEYEKPGSPFTYEEGDTLRAGVHPPLNLQAWFAHYARMDSAFRNAGFRASGVRIHIDSFETVNSPETAQTTQIAPLLSPSPDSTQLLDIWSYNRLVETDSRGRKAVVGGGPDQQVIWIDTRSGKRRQILFNGSNQAVETADWLDDRSFVLGMMNIDEPLGQWTPEILLFNLDDSAYTNFRYPKPLAIDSLPRAGRDFITTWLESRQFRRE